MITELVDSQLTSGQFEDICQRLHQICGIHLQPGKEGLVKARLTKRLRVLGLSDFDAYLSYLETDSSRQEVTAMIDALSTNKTSFFREEQHFDLLNQQILPEWASSKRPLRVWCAGCSTGEEAYTLAMVLSEGIPNIAGRDVRILATDISTEVLRLAQEAKYTKDAAKSIPPRLLGKYFTIVSSEQARTYQVSSELRSMIRLARLNLMESWPMKGPFDAIFCRNVMIYFDKPTRERLAQRFRQLLSPGGHLFIGHSESLTGMRVDLSYVKPAVYVR